MDRIIEERNTATVVVETAIFSLVMALSLFGNLLVCYAVYRNPRLRCPSNYFIISLAFSDIFQALCTMPLSIGMLATSNWPFGTFACYFLTIISLAIILTIISLAIISIYTMVLMALNRYYKIVKPAKYQTIFKERFIIATALLVWVVAILYSFLTALVLGYDPKPDPRFALCAVTVYPFSLPVYFVIMYLPYVIIIFCYWKIHKVVKMHNANVSWQSSNVEDVKISKTLFVTVIGFVAVWMPAHSIYLATLAETSLPSELTLFATFLVFSSSCANPFIYGFMNRSFKNEFMKCLKLKRTHMIATNSS